MVVRKVGLKMNVTRLGLGKMETDGRARTGWYIDTYSYTDFLSLLIVVVPFVFQGLVDFHNFNGWWAFWFFFQLNKTSSGIFTSIPRPNAPDPGTVPNKHVFI